MKEEKTSDSQSKINGKNIRELVMKRIRKRKIKMRKASFFLAEKMGLKGTLFLLFVLGALIISLIFGFFKNTQILEFINLGFPGVKLIILTLPYGYIAIFLIIIITFIYFARKLDIPCHKNMSHKRIAIYFFIASFLFGTFFIAIGINEAIKGWSRNEISPHLSVSGKIIKVTPKEVVIEEKKGKVTHLVFDKRDFLPSRKSYVEGKYLRAVGSRDREEDGIFHVQGVLCCEDN